MQYICRGKKGGGRDKATLGTRTFIRSWKGGREGSPAYLPLLCTVLHFACSVEWGVEEAASWDSYFSWMEHHCKDGILLGGEQRFIEHRATGALGHEDLASGRCAYNP